MKRKYSEAEFTIIALNDVLMLSGDTEFGVDYFEDWGLTGRN